MSEPEQKSIYYKFRISLYYYKMKSNLYGEAMKYAILIEQLETKTKSLARLQTSLITS